MILINNKYKIIEKIGEGSFGNIFKGENIRTKEYVAIKVEPINNNLKLLKNESTVYQYLKNTIGIPSIKWFGKDEDNYYMVINLLGNSLQNIKDKYFRFPLKNVLQIGIYILNILKTIHEKKLIHRDIKPDNFLFSKTNEKPQLYLIDFGFCKTYLHTDGRHIENKPTHGLIGSPSYASINSHDNQELSRRDDLESLGYMLLYFYVGKLEWNEIDLSLTASIERNQIIKNMKKDVINKKLPEIFMIYFKYVWDLKFEETPNYFSLIEIFKSEISNKICVK